MSTYRGSEDAGPFSSLAIWREKVHTDLRDLPQSRDFKLRLLLEQGTDCEQAVYGCLKQALFELQEALSWGMLTNDFVEKEINELYNLAAAELKFDKGMILDLAREHNLQDEYWKEVRRAVNHTGGYSSLGELRFALLAWRANLARDLSLVSKMSSADAEEIVGEAYCAALHLVARCVTTSSEFWKAQHSGSIAPGKENEIKKQAMQVVEMWLLEDEEMRQHFSVEALRRLLDELRGVHECTSDEFESAGEDRYEVHEGGERGREPRRASRQHFTY